MINANDNIKFFLYKFTPVILLFTSILNEIDFNNSEFKYFSFNFAYILIFHYSLKREGSIGYIIIFIAGLFNDVVNGIPMGISSLTYLLLCAAAAYLRNITLRPSLIKDWIFFLITISVVNSLLYTILTFILSFKIDYFYFAANTIFTFLLYIIFSYLFDFYENKIIGRAND